jgi:hypothetical protein
MRKLLKPGETMKPYIHDCKDCRWVGWFSPWADKPPMNIYLCPNKERNDTVIIRFSDEPSDYWSKTVGESTKGEIMAMKLEGK